MNHTMMDWKAIPWHKLERTVFKLQKRIFKASQRGDGRTVRQLQKTLMRSWSAKCIAVRKVTQDNQGKKTAGIDGVKDLSPPERLTLVSELTNPTSSTHSSSVDTQAWFQREAAIRYPNDEKQGPPSPDKAGVRTGMGSPSNPIATALDPDAPPMTQEKLSITVSGKQLNMYWMLILPNASTVLIIKPY